MKVLLGIGGTEDSYRALEAVVERAGSVGDDLTVAVVADPDSDAAAESVDERVRAVLESAGLDEAVPVRRLDGDPGPALVDLAEREGFDRLVLGGGTRSPMGKITLGDLAEYVLLNARVTVTLVR